MAHMLASGRIGSVRFLIDRGFQTSVRTAKLYKRFIGLFGEEAAVAVYNHAKFVCLTNSRWSIVITTSMNMNNNPRIEHYCIEDNRAIAEHLIGYVDRLADEMPAGLASSRPQQNHAFRAVFRDPAGGTGGARSAVGRLLAGAASPTVQVSPAKPGDVGDPFVLEVTRDERLTPKQWVALEALLLGSNRSQAAKKAGVAASTVASWAKKSVFKTILAEFRAERIGRVLRTVDDLVPIAVATLQDVMMDPTQNGSSRIAAAKEAFKLSGLSEANIRAELVGAPAAVERVPESPGEHRQQLLLAVRRLRSAAEQAGSYVATTNLLKLEVDMLAPGDAVDSETEDRDLMRELSTAIESLPAGLRQQFTASLANHGGHS